MSKAFRRMSMASVALTLMFGLLIMVPSLKVSAEEITETPTEEVPEEIVDTTAPVLITKDVTRDEGESVPDISEFIASNPENLPVTCTTIDSSELVVSQPATNKLIPVTCSIEDEAGNITTSTSNLIVNNVVPSVVIIAQPSTTFEEGSVYSIIANITYGSPKLTYNWLADCSGSGELGSYGLTSQPVFYSAVGSHYCGINVVDADGDTAAASILVDVTPKSASNNTESITETPTNNSSTDTTETPVENENSNTTTEPEVKGEQTENPVSNTQSENSNSQSINTTSSSTSSQTTSPLVIICLVAGAILIIGLLLFLFFRGNDEDEDEEVNS